MVQSLPVQYRAYKHHPYSSKAFPIPPVTLIWQSFMAKSAVLWLSGVTQAQQLASTVILTSGSFALRMNALLITQIPVRGWNGVISMFQRRSFSWAKWTDGQIIELNEGQMKRLAENFKAIAQKYGLLIESCSEKINLVCITAHTATPSIIIIP